MCVLIYNYLSVCLSLFTELNFETLSPILTCYIWAMTSIMPLSCYKLTIYTHTNIDVSTINLRYTTNL